MKVCSTCSVAKPIESFGRRKTSPDGREGRCRECVRPRKNAQLRSYRKVNDSYRARARERARRERAEGRRNRLLTSYQSARNYSGSVEEYAEHWERWRMGCGSSGAWKSWLPRRTRRQRVRRIPCETDAERWKRLYHGDPKFMLWERQRNQFKKWIKGERKTNSLARAVDYTRDELRSHIERQFLRGMDWSNYGEWHIDHIKPKHTFNPTDAADVRACWSLPNLRPLWASQNCARPRGGDTLL